MTQHKGQPPAATGGPVYGTVETFAAIIRSLLEVHDYAAVLAITTGLVCSIVDPDTDITDTQRAEWVRNALAAADLVWAEIEASR